MPLRFAGTYAFALVAATAVVSAANASIPFFRDVTIVSENGRYRLEAKSPDNAKGWPGARHFTYTLLDHATNATLWSRQQPDNEGSPKHVSISDQGDVVILDSGETLRILSGKDGGAVVGPNIIVSLPVDERDRYGCWTTAGFGWQRFARFGFIDLPADADAGEARYVAVRTFWDRRIVIDLTTGMQVDIGAASLDASAKPPAGRAATIVARLLESEAAWARRTLDREAALASAKSLKVSDRVPEWRDLLAAVHLAGCRRLRDTLPALRAIEEIRYEDSYGQREIRAALHLALRRIGEVPAIGPVLAFPPHDTAKAAEAAPFVEFAQRAERASGIREGMSMEEVASLIGGPDAEFFDRSMEWSRCLDWDLDGAGAGSDPTTLRIAFDVRTGRVRAVRRIQPPIWKAGYERELGHLVDGCVRPGS